jgi:DNA-directed RNA polymerase subunit RPC12/RpoP
MDACLAFKCPHCDAQLTIPDNLWYYACSQCGQRLDLKSQFAFLRGIDAFTEGQDLFQKIHPKKRKLFIKQENEALELFRQAYSSLQVAFMAELEEHQRILGVEMMASMNQEFLRRSMTSPLEVQYWNTLMILQTAQNEYDRLNKKLAVTTPGLLGQIQRMRWNARKNQLAHAIVKQESKLNSIEQQIEFIDIPKARSKTWKL